MTAKIPAVLAVTVALALGLAGDAEAAKRKSSKAVIGLVNLNQATPSQLAMLPGVGEKAAKRIVEHRAKTPFARIEELVKVKGFGKKKFEKLKANLAVSGPTTAKSVKAGALPAPPAGDSGQAQGRTGAAAQKR